MSTFPTTPTIPPSNMGMDTDMSLMILETKKKLEAIQKARAKQVQIAEEPSRKAQELAKKKAETARKKLEVQKKIEGVTKKVEEKKRAEEEREGMKKVEAKVGGVVECGF